MSQYERSKRWKEKNRAKVAENQRRYRAENGKEATAEALAKRRSRNWEWWQEYKSKVKCKKCGESHIACMAFHHRDPSQKTDTITRMVSRRMSLKRIMAEIVKCDVLCHNCHAKLHWEERQNTSAA